MKHVAVAGILLAAVAAGCGSKATATRNVQDAEAMKAALLREMPVGTPIADAQRIMEREGFKCEERKDRSFSEMGNLHEGIDFLLCTRADETEDPLMKRKWIVAVVDKDDKVSDIL